jgi:hypothetical protein
MSRRHFFKIKQKKLVWIHLLFDPDSVDSLASSFGLFTSDYQLKLKIILFKNYYQFELYPKI